MPDTNKPNPAYVNAPFEFSEWTPEHGLVSWKETRRLSDRICMRGVGQLGERIYTELIFSPRFGLFKPVEEEGNHYSHRCDHLAHLTNEVDTLKYELRRCREDRDRLLKEGEPVIRVEGGTVLNGNQAVECVESARQIIECIGMLWIHNKIQAAQRWMERYFPNRD